MPAYPVADAHVDVLWRMVNESLSFYGESPLQASFERLLHGQVRTQVFALYVDTQQSGQAQLEEVLRSIDCFYEEVLSSAQMKVVTSRADLQSVRDRDGLASLLSIEGGGCLRGNPAILRTLHRLGVRGMGLTWNPANELADGCREPRGAGLTSSGREVVEEMVRLGMWIDLAHLADAGVHDILKLTSGPVMASHANVRKVHEHPRNLTDDVIVEIIHRGGWMGLTFEGSFVAPVDTVDAEDLLSHVDHVLALGGEDILGFGSDFDGTSNAIPGLETAADYAAFAEILCDRYGEALARKMLFDNFERFLFDVLPV